MHIIVPNGGKIKNFQIDVLTRIKHFYMTTNYTKRSRIGWGEGFFYLSVFLGRLLERLLGFNILQVSGIWDQGSGNREQGTGIREQGSGNRDQ